MSFSEFVSEQQKMAQQKAAKRNSEITFFQEQVKLFYQLVETEWLKQFIDEGTIRVSHKGIKIQEEALGAYDVDVVTILLGDCQLQLRPVGTILVGARGRIDLVYRDKVAKFVLIHDNITSPNQLIHITEGNKPMNQTPNANPYAWKVVEYKNNLSGVLTPIFSTLDSAKFLDVIMYLVNGKSE